VQDVNYATRWLKAHAADFNGDPESVAGLGTSSGGHTVMLSALRPRDPRYSVLELSEEPEVDATLRYVLCLWAVLDPHTRYLYAKEFGRDQLVTWSEAYFLTEDAMREGNPQSVLERGEQTDLPPTLVIEPIPDDNVPESIPQRFVGSYREAGGHVEIERFQDAYHGFMREQSANTEAALAVIKGFVARQLSALGQRAPRLPLRDEHRI
jgi:acetyl esterase